MPSRHLHWDRGLRRMTRQPCVDWRADGALDRADPYLVWFDITGFEGLESASALRFLVEFAGGAADSFQSVEIATEDLDGLMEALREGVVLRYELSAPLRTADQANAATQPLRLPPRHLQPQGRQLDPKLRRMVGFIDYGCAFAHRQFRVWRNGKPTPETRVAALWDQNGLDRTSRAKSGGLVWSVPADFGYGAQTLRDFRADAENESKADYKRLNEHIRSHLSNDIVDERACYAESGHLAVKRAVTHGTHIMDIATGHPSPLAAVPALQRADAQPHDLPIVFVSLPVSSRGVGVGGMLRAQVLDGLRYILSFAAPETEVIVNVSYGAYAGPHDGTTLIERALDAEIAARGSNLKVVVAAGNARDRSLHAEASVLPMQTATFLWNNRPDDGTDSFVEFWLSDQGLPAAERPLLRVRPPGAHLASNQGWLDAGEVGGWLHGGSPVAALVRPRRPCQSTTRSMALLAAAPTKTGLGRAAAPYGQWEIEVRNRSREVLKVDAWIERDEPAFGTEATPRQSYFSDSPTAKVSGKRTLSSLATGQRTLVVGGYTVDTGPSGDVRTELAARPGRNFLAPSAESAVHDGLPAAAVWSGRTVRLNGTSVAAAYVTRLLIQGEIKIPEAEKGLVSSLPKAVK